MELTVLLETTPKELLVYQNSKGVFPFEIWLNGLNDIRGRAVIRKRLNRIRLGSLGDSKFIGSGVFELKINFGPGYRVYFGKKNEAVIVLLCGGNNSTQKFDIQIAKKYWADFLFKI